MTELFKGSLSVDLRQDGAHLIWEYRPKQDGILAALVPQQRHEIILRDVQTAAVFSRGSLDRIRAYCASILTEGPAVDRKKLQKKWEAKIDKGELPEAVEDSHIEFVCETVRAAFNQALQNERRWIRDGLKNAVIRAHEKFTREECEQIIDEAIIESVMAK